MTRPQSKQQALLRAIPKVDEFLAWVLAGKTPVVDKTVPLAVVKKTIRQLLAGKRQAIIDGTLSQADALSRAVLLVEFKPLLSANLRPNFRRLINATGVVVHTNLGRSLLPESAMRELLTVGTHYSNLEFDLKTGKRGSRYSLVEELLCELTGAEAALVVNNNAAAVLLVLSTLAAGREVIVSRGQLVEIGGSFRIPEVMARSGAKLVEVGATNRTHLRDYQRAITTETGLLLKVHTSNFKIIGFTSEVPLAELVALGRAQQLAVMEDLGSGCLVDLSRFGLGKEPTVGEVIATGVDVVTCSGDKLFGGPQAGLIVGKKAVIEQVKQNPLNRALRIDKFTLAGLEAILRLYYDEATAVKTIPTLAMLSAPLPALAKKAARLLRLVKKKLASHCQVESVQAESRVGGGALPEQALPSRAVALRPLSISVNVLEQGLMNGELPIIGRIEHDALLLDMRTVADQEVKELAAALLNYFNS